MDSYSKDSKHYALGGKNKIERNDLHKKKMLYEFDSLSTPPTFTQFPNVQCNFDERYGDFL